MSDGPEWFAERRYGYGSGPPITWQGWALTIGFVAIVIVLSMVFGKHPLKLCASLALPTILFIFINARTTRGGWRWRWGEKE